MVLMRIGAIAFLWFAVVLVGCGDESADEVLQGSRDLPQVPGRITARDAFELVYPSVLQISSQPIMLLITSGPGIDGEGRSDSWEFVFHFPDRSAQGVYGFEPIDPERSQGGLRMRWRISPRRDLKGAGDALLLDFADSPEAARELGRMGVDWVAGDADMTLAARRLSSGETVWVVESNGKEYRTPFARPPR